ncbi:LOW QUALITY PROTEIN: uncharacterized protein LOC108221561 [Daucus carota subsp. sativus]|uniref:LOW QUALITY PROTEIN: uncharacterized protein LOC108221561 n=1 Tax=Daucus carota subsp. sativus TaxID=79200 RepID=UPI003082CAFB
MIDFKEKMVAVKRAKSMSKQGSKEFLTEIKMLSQFQHSHLVSLVGYCDDCEEMILVYDYLPSGTLADRLYKKMRNGDSSLPCLTWVQRLKICIGAARGLDYLHTGTGIDDRVIHRDVKTSNILLDENLAAKISDFGLSKTGPANQTCTYVSTRVKGTRGYLDPYYMATRRLTRKSDVYSFGVVLFEVLCGRPAVDSTLEGEQISLAEWGQHCFKEGVLEQIIDPSIKMDLSSDSLNTYVDVAIKCLHIQPKLRPTMTEVLVALESALALQEKSTYYTLVEIQPSDYTTEKDVDSLTLNVRNTYYKQEHKHTEDLIVNTPDDWHHNKKYSARMTFTKRVSVLFSVTARAFSGNRDAKKSRLRNSLLSANIVKSQAAKTQTFIPVYTSVPIKPWIPEEVLQSSALKNFKFNDLNLATRMFHPESIIGQGGFGHVYKGWIDQNTFAAAKWGTGLVIAVKRLSPEAAQGHHEWLVNISFLVSLGKLCHPNIIKMIGYCAEEEHRLLVYEFISQGSLDKQLWSKDSYLQPLSWNLRINIALGAAKGLAYLHSPETSVIHRDFKASNILIDSEYNAKLSDFGLAKINGENEDTHISTLIVGTYGYLAPEYCTTGHLSTKCDVYGFGVVLLEMLTGRRAYDQRRPENEYHLVDWAKPYLTSKRKSLHVMDPHIKGQYIVKAASSAISLALECVSSDPKLRPDANYVVKALEQLQDLKN